MLKKSSTKTQPNRDKFKKVKFSHKKASHRVPWLSFFQQPTNFFISYIEIILKKSRKGKMCRGIFLMLMNISEDFKEIQLWSFCLVLNWGWYEGR